MDRRYWSLPKPPNEDSDWLGYQIKSYSLGLRFRVPIESRSVAPVQRQGCRYQGIVTMMILAHSQTTRFAVGTPLLRSSRPTVKLDRN